MVWPFSRKKAAASESRPGSGAPTDPFRPPPDAPTTASVDFGDGSSGGLAMTGACRAVGGPTGVEPVAACYWRVQPSRKDAPKYHVEF